MQKDIDNCENIALTMDLELHETNHNPGTKEDSNIDAPEELFSEPPA